MTANVLLSGDKPVIYLRNSGGTVAVPTIGTGPPGAAGATGATGATGPSGGPLPGGGTDGQVVQKSGGGVIWGPTPVAVDELVVSVMDHGAVGDGTTNDQAAIAAAITAAGTNGKVFFPPAVYAVSTSLTMGSVTLEGYGATIKKTGSAVGNFITISAASVAPCLRGLKIDGNSLVTGILVNFVAGATTDAIIEDCTLTTGTTVGTTIGIRVRDGVTRLFLRRNLIDRVWQAVYTDGAATFLTYQQNRIKNWCERGFYFVGTSSLACTDVNVLDNRITDVLAGGSVVQPIVFEGDDALLHQRIRVNYNTVIGPARSHNNATPGTADNISLHRCSEFELIGNISRDGGDLGIAVNFCKRGIVANNVCVSNDTAGVCLGWTQVSPQAYASGITVHGNVFMNNGQNRNADRLDVGRCGVRAVQATECLIGGNMIGDDQGSPTQKYGCAFTDCSDIEYGPDHDLNNVISMYFLESGNTRVGPAVPFSGMTITGTPTSGQVPTATSGTAASWQSPALSKYSAGMFATPTAISNTTTDTTFWTPPTLAAVSLVAGTTRFRLHAAGNMDQIATSGNFTFRFKLGGTTVISCALSPSVSGAATLVLWDLMLDIFIETIGASGFVSAIGFASAVNTSAGARNDVPYQALAVASDLSGGFIPTLTAVMATANAGNIIRPFRASLDQLA